MEKLVSPVGVKKNRKRLGRGPGSGTGKTAGKGHKGQNARKGGGVRPGFEGGQTPLFRRLPKRGFKNDRFKKEVFEVNVSLLEKYDFDEKIDKKVLIERGIMPSKYKILKVLGNGDLSKKVEIEADKFSKSAVEKIERVGGKVITVDKKSDSKKDT